MITEDYCSYEVSKLLDEKGFEFPTYSERIYEPQNGYYQTCTHQMALKFLREKYGIIITIDYDEDEDTKDEDRYGFTAYREGKREVDLLTYPTFEEATEGALSHVLNKIVKNKLDMKQEEKSLLLKYLCMALPYGVKVQTPNGIGNLNTINLTLFGHELGINIKPTERETFEIKNCKPYLRPMSSMTEEEMEEYALLSNDGGWGITEGLMTDCIDLLLANHFDFMGLIPMGAAIEVTENNNPYKD